MGNIVLTYGAHSDDSDGVCLLEACSLPPGEGPRPGVHRTDHPSAVCYVRAAFGRALNDCYGAGEAADEARTRDLLPLVEALRGTSARKDSEEILVRLLNRSLSDWWPRSLDAWAAALRAEGFNAAATTFEELAEALRGLEPAALAALAARAALAAPVLADIRREMSAELLATCNLPEEVAA